MEAASTALGDIESPPGSPREDTTSHSLGVDEFPGERQGRWLNRDTRLANSGKCPFPGRGEWTGRAASVATLGVAAPRTLDSNALTSPVFFQMRSLP